MRDIFSQLQSGELVRVQPSASGEFPPHVRMCVRYNVERMRLLGQHGHEARRIMRNVECRISGDMSAGDVRRSKKK